MHNKLFPDPFPKIPEANVQYIKSFYDAVQAKDLKNKLREETPWRQNKIQLFGKTYDEPRLTQLYGDNDFEYSYSGITFKALSWTPLLQQIKLEVENVVGSQFNICLLNLYRSGQDSNGWHADNEKELGVNPVIASLSLGAQRYFHLKHNSNKKWRFKFPLEHGSLLIMKDETQHTYKHQIAKTSRAVEERINLTFRKVV